MFVFFVGRPITPKRVDRFQKKSGTEIHHIEEGHRDYFSYKTTQGRNHLLILF